MPQQPDIRKYLEDIRLGIESIDEHLQHKRDFRFFLDNKTARRAVERELEIIGEPTNRILKINPDILITHARKIVNLRNMVAHAYDSITNEGVWGIVVNDLPKLKAEVAELLSQ